jgi:two-component system phosphate regulon sensor histidine kinase PhoR
MSLARSDYTTRELETLDVSDMLEDVVSRLLTVAEEKNILIDSSDIYCNETEPITALGDKISISELFIILIENAIKYTPEKGCVTVRAFRGTGKTIVDVSDTGIGIAENDLPHIFDRFYRAEKSHNKAGAGGFGIGLSIAKSIAEGNMAKIDVESELGKGTTFRVQLKAR